MCIEVVTTELDVPVIETVPLVAGQVLNVGDIVPVKRRGALRHNSTTRHRTSDRRPDPAHLVSEDSDEIVFVFVIRQKFLHCHHDKNTDRRRCRHVRMPQTWALGYFL